MLEGTDEGGLVAEWAVFSEAGVEVHCEEEGGSSRLSLSMKTRTRWPMASSKPKKAYVN